jgi:hypothetical protein
MRYLSKTLTLAAAIFAAAPAVAQSPARPRATAAAGASTSGDVRCLLTMLAIANQQRQQHAAQQPGQYGVYFYVGRLSARAPGLDLGQAMRAEVPHLDGKALDAEARRCGPIIGRAMQGAQAGLMSLRQGGQPAAPAGSAPPPAPPAPTPQ